MDTTQIKSDDAMTIIRPGDEPDTLTIGWHVWEPATETFTVVTATVYEVDLRSIVRKLFSDERLQYLFGAVQDEVWNGADELTPATAGGQLAPAAA